MSLSQTSTTQAKPNQTSASTHPPELSLPPVLNQATTGLLSASELSVDRSPRLHTIFDNLCVLTSQQLMSLSHTPIELTLERVWSGQMQDINISDSDHIIVQFEIQSCQEPIYFSIDRPALFLLIEALLGATSSPRPYTTERNFTSLELAFAQQIAKKILCQFHQQFSSITDMTSTFKQSFTGNELENGDHVNTVFLTANIALDVFGRTAQVRVFLPLSVLSPYKSSFAVETADTNEVVDKVWTDHIKNQFASSEVECQAILEGGQLCLSQIAQLKVGQVLQLNVEAGNSIKLNCEGKTLFMSKLGQSNGVFTVKVTEFPQPQKTLLETILTESKNATI